MNNEIEMANNKNVLNATTIKKKYRKERKVEIASDQGD